MGLIRRLRTVGSLAVVVVGVPMLMVGNASHGSAGLTDTGAALGSTTGTVTGTTATGSSAVSGATGALSGTNGSATSNTSSSASCSSTTPTNLPADKMTVGASDIQVMDPQADVTLLCAQMRTSNPADLTFAVTLECSIVTSVTTTGNDSQSAFGDVKVWVEVDGKNVGVLPAQPGQSDNGQVTFCNRVYSSTTSGFPPTDSQATINTFQSTKDANAFNWVAMNVGSQVHTISIHATLTSGTTSSKDMAQAVVGARTVVVNVTQTAQNAVQ